ncbi:STAS domain-containing protein [Actinomadura macrotermitis]|uniref:Anti-sigma factor antagonist n=1 Tax=Actinomadura macrotermitis TaxID=2585200 RepID=A0A7K0BLQ1_9ACTN|nr:STAS domain-containing protein [Actinomadura macrotermitis]MQY02109.1 Anti-sigma-B factor antagonist [Actinomadura macrotermitis]
MNLSLRTGPAERVAVVHIGGEIDIACADGMRDHLMAALRAAEDALVVDFAGVEFMDCSGLRALVAARARAEFLRKRLYLASVPERVQRIIRLGGLDGAFAYCNEAAVPDHVLS